MKLSEYEQQAMTTASYPTIAHYGGLLPVYPALGLSGESGEFADKVKKAWRNGTPLDRAAALRELGDVLWYVTAAACDLDSSLEEVARMNVAKLADRAKRGVIKSEGDDR
jgi:NTP pyrophosphatase (non-canonical NTP hydrolase)